jgi:hypothetical protein
VLIKPSIFRPKKLKGGKEKGGGPSTEKKQMKTLWAVALIIVIKSSWAVIVLTDTIMQTSHVNLAISRLEDRMTLSSRSDASIRFAAVAPCDVSILFANGTKDPTRSANFTNRVFQHTPNVIDHGQLVLDSIDFAALSDVGMMGIALINSTGMFTIASQASFPVFAHSAYVLVGITDAGASLMQPNEQLRITMCAPSTHTPLIVTTDGVTVEHALVYEQARLTCPLQVPLDNGTVTPLVAWNLQRQQLSITVPRVRDHVFVLIRMQLTAFESTVPSQSGTILMVTIIVCFLVLVIVGCIVGAWYYNDGRWCRQI